MTNTVSRRGLIVQAAAAGLAAALPPAATASDASGIKLGEAAPFSFESLTAAARALAGKPFVATPVRGGDILEKVDFDAYQQISFRKENTLFAGSKYPVQLFHLGRYFKQPVKIAIVENGQARELVYDPSLFSYGPKAAPLVKKLPANLGFAGFRLQEAGVASDWLAWLGASYFRSAGELGQYGLSARGLAIDTIAAKPEEFPRFTAFYLEQQPDAVVVSALLDSQSATGAFRFRCSKPKAVVMDVEARVFARKDIERLGFAPLTSMFWYSETNQRQAFDWRPQVHDSEGLALWTGSGERIWRPLNNPPQVMTNSFLDTNPKGFGLIQRDRDFTHYEDDGVFYDKRPTLWVEPRSEWGEGMVQLVEIPTVDEVHDNIVAYWTPRTPVKAGSAFSLDYRLHWTAAEPFPVTSGHVVSTRRGRGGNPAVRDKASQNVKYVIDFEGGDLATRQTDKEPAIAEISASRGKVINPFAIRVQGTDRWRMFFDLEVKGPAPVDLRGYLRSKSGQALTETWLYQHFPAQPNL